MCVLQAEKQALPGLPPLLWEWVCWPAGGRLPVRLCQPVVKEPAAGRSLLRLRLSCWLRAECQWPPVHRAMEGLLLCTRD